MDPQQPCVSSDPRPTLGLEGVVVAETSLSEVDGERGRVLVAGYPLEAVASGGFGSACALVWDGRWPDPAREASLSGALGRARVSAFECLDRLGDALDQPLAMGALRAAVAHLDVGDATWPSEAVIVTAAMSVFTAAWSRRRQRLAPVAPDPTASPAADHLRMLRDDEPGPEEARALSVYWATVIEHGFNASTFAARVVASTEGPTSAAVLAGLGALEGRLHGGAPGPVLDMFDSVHAAGDARAWIVAELEAGRRIMGMGHRVYRVRDPRAAILEESSGGSSRARGVSPSLARSSASPRRCSASGSRSGRSGRTSSSTPRSCSRPWPCRATCSRRRSLAPAWPGGALTCASSGGRVD